MPAGLSGLEFGDPPIPILIALGGIGPLVASIALTYLTQGRQGRRDYWRRVIDFKRISVGWYAIILLIVPILTAVAVLLDVLSGGRGAYPETRFQANLASILPFAIFTLFFGPLPEELGWRGYALDGLQGRYGALASSLILGIGWTLWHMPLFLIEGSYQNSLGWGSVGFWWYMSDKTLESILMTWIYNHNQRSTLSAVLFHFMVNFTGELFALTPQAELYQIVVWAVAAIVVTVVWGPDTLTRKRGELRA